MERPPTNRVVVSGRVVKDAPTRTLPSGDFAVNFRIAVPHVRRNLGGQETRQTFFFPVSMTGGPERREQVEGLLRKGTPVCVTGHLQARSWDASDGTGKREVTEIAAHRVEPFPEGPSGPPGESMQEPPAPGGQQAAGTPSA